jgi:hypothetical protein
MATLEEVEDHLAKYPIPELASVTGLSEDETLANLALVNPRGGDGPVVVAYRDEREARRGTWHPADRCPRKR